MDGPAGELLYKRSCHRAPQLFPPSTLTSEWPSGRGATVMPPASTLHPLRQWVSANVWEVSSGTLLLAMTRREFLHTWTEPVPGDSTDVDIRPVSSLCDLAETRTFPACVGGPAHVHPCRHQASSAATGAHTHTGGRRATHGQPPRVRGARPAYHPECRFCPM